MNRTATSKAAERERPGAKITRDFDLPRKALFEWFADPKKAAKWFGTPEGAVKVLFELDPRPGGVIRIHDSLDGKVATTEGTILELVAPELLVFRSTTSPPDGGAPWEALQTVKLEELGSQRTRVTVAVKVLATGAFPGGVDSLEQGYEGGWGETFETLRRLLR